MSTTLDVEETHRRMPTLWCIEDGQIRGEVARLTARAPAYFWDVAASTSGYHHPLCRGDHGLWVHTLMLSTVIDRLADSYTEREMLTEHEIDLAHAAAILHDQRKNGPPENPVGTSTSDHDLAMARVIREESDLNEAVADVVAAHMGPWYDGPEPKTPLEELVHVADMVASTATITPAVRGPVPEELLELGVEEVSR